MPIIGFLSDFGQRNFPEIMGVQTQPIQTIWVQYMFGYFASKSSRALAPIENFFTSE